ncbi:MAG: WG repeat-containing protein [Flavobacteriales bacterium]
MLLLLSACGGASTHPTNAQDGPEPATMKYNKVFPSNELGFAKVNVGEGEAYAEGIIDGKGNEVIAPRTDMLVNDITGAQALVQRGREFLFVDLDSGLVDADQLSAEKGYQYAEPFRCGRALVQVDDRWFYIDSMGTNPFGIDFDFDFAETFHYDRAMVKEGEQYRIIDTGGKTVARMNYDQVNLQSPWRWQVTNIKGDVYWSGFVDLDGKEVVPLVYDEVGYYDEEVKRLRVGKGEKYGFLDELAQVAIPIIYEYAEIFDKRKARVMLNGRQFFIDPNGMEVTE